MDLLLIYPDYSPDPQLYGDAEGIGEYFWNCEPLSLEYVASGVRDCCDTVTLLDLRFQKVDLEKVFADNRPDVVGLTGYSMHVPGIQKLTAQIKSFDTSIITVIGGIHASLMPEDFFEDDIDFIVKGDGGSGMARILEVLNGGDQHAELPNIWSKRNGSFAFGETSPLVNPCSLAPPDRTISSHVFGKFHMGGLSPIALLRTSAGCPYRCTFCSLWSLMEGKYFVREIENVLEELEQLPTDNVHFVDDEPWLDSSRMGDFAHRILEAGIQKNYLLYARIDTITDRTEILEKWIEAGLRKVVLGVEAVTEKELEEYGKKISIAKIENAYKILRDLDLEAISLFIIKPTYLQRDFTRVKRFIERNKVEFPMFTILTPLPGTDLLKDDFSRITEMLPNGRPDWYQWDFQHPVTPTAMRRDAFLHEYVNLRLMNL